MTGGVTEGFTIFNALTDHAILSEVSPKEASDFFWSNDPTHPAISRLEKEQNKTHHYDYFNNYDLELAVWRDHYSNKNLYDFSPPAYHTKDEWAKYYKEDNDRQLEFKFTYPSDFDYTLSAVSEDCETFSDLPVLDSDED